MGGFIDIPAGTTFEKLTVIERAPDRCGQTFFLCRCECGNEVDVNSVRLRNGEKTHCGCDRKPPGRVPRPKPYSGMRLGSHSRSRSAKYGSFATGRQGFSESREIDFSKPAFGSVQVGEGRYFWVAFRRLSDWHDGGEPLDSGYHTNEGKAHASAREAVRHLLTDRAQLPPMPQAWVEALHRRLTEEPIVQEQVARWMAVLERDDDIIAGYDWQEICEANDFDVIDFSADQDVDDSLQAIDADEDEAEVEAA